MGPQWGACSLRKPEKPQLLHEATHGKEIRPGTALGQGQPQQALALTINESALILLPLASTACSLSPSSPYRSNDLKLQNRWTLKSPGERKQIGAPNLRRKGHLRKADFEAQSQLI